MILRDADDHLEVTCVDKLLPDRPCAGDVRLHVKAKTGDLALEYDEVWIHSAELLRFVHELTELETTRRGEASLKSISPGEFQFTVRTIDHAGHTAGIGFLAPWRFSRFVECQHRIGFAIEFCPSELPRILAEFRTMVVGELDLTKMPKEDWQRATEVWKSYRAKMPEEETRLLRCIADRFEELTRILEDCSDHWRYEDPIYRFYHQSYKVYALQETTSKLVAIFQSLAPHLPLNKWFMEIVKEGTGKEFKDKDNEKWTAVTRPIVEAFFHARYFLEMMCRYGNKLTEPPDTIPSGWASVLYLYNLR